MCQGHGIINNHWLRVGDTCVFGGRVAIVADRQVSAQPVDVTFSIHVCHQTGVFVTHYFGPIGSGNARAFLAAMLERKKTVKTQTTDIHALTIDPKNPAFFIQFSHKK